jgi:hypothetical protein
MGRGVRTRVAAMIAALTLVAAIAAIAPGMAWGAPTEPTIGLAALQAKLDAAPGNTIPGYFKTVLKGSTIETVGVQIVGITTVGNPDLGGMPARLVMFEATGTVADAIGGIAAGMSGSPVFVDDGGIDKLVGAVSYGDVFTLHNAGLATPIEYMTDMESIYPPKATTMSLVRPARLHGRTFAHVLVAPSASAARAAFQPADTLVVSPLTTFELGGIPSTSPLFKAMRSRFESRGVELVAATMGGAYDPNFETTLTGGAAVAAMAVRGDMWFGAAGTVTYATTDTVVAFGHPLFWSGPSGLELTNAWVDGIWPSSYEAYKLISPTKVRGTLTQDRNVGVSGRLDVLPQETTVTAHATMADDGVSVDTVSYLPRWVVDSADWMFTGLPAEPVLSAPYRAQNAAAMPGSAVTTATIVVSDGTKTYTYQRADVIDSSYDIASETGYSLFDAVYTLQSLNAPDITKAHIVSVDLNTTMTRTRRGATVVDVKVLGGIHTGINTVLTTLRLHDGTRRTVSTPLYVKSGAGTQGYLTVGAPGWMNYGPNYDSFMYFGPDGYYPSEPGESDQTAADVVAQLQGAPKNSDLQVTFEPWGGYGPGSSDMATAAGGTDSFLRGVVSKTTSTVYLRPVPSRIGYGNSVRLRGYVYGASGDTTMTLLMRPFGGTLATTVATFKATAKPYYTPSFDFTAKRLTSNATYFVRWDGNAGTLGAQASFAIHVDASVRIGASVKGGVANLSATVAPAQNGSKIVFEYLDGRTWKAIKTVTLTGGKTAAFAWRPARGSYKVRARFAGSTANSGAVSGQIGVVVR